jgi:hypothetical protein
MRRLIAEGGLRSRDPELLAIEFMGPLLLWRYWHAINPNESVVVNRTAFVRHHVDQFLNGAEMQPAERAMAGARRTA